MSADIVGCESARLFTAASGPLTRKTTLGFEAIDFAQDVLGVQLLPWQRWLFLHSLELTPDRSGFRFRTVLVLVARQNGKTLWAQVLSLWRMYVDRAALVLGTAQNLDVAEEVWAGAVDMAEGTPELAEEIVQVERAAGKKTLHLTGKQRYKVQSANRRGGRGMSGDLVLLDELREHQTWDSWAAVTKTTMARPRPQIVCLSNAGDDASVVLNDLRAKALSAVDDPAATLGIFEWSADADCSMDDRDQWARANPSLGHLIPAVAIEAARDTDPPHVFRTEVLCQRVDRSAASALPLWPERTDLSAQVSPGARVAFAVDVSWDRTTSWIAAAAELPDGRIVVEVTASAPGTDWVPEWLAVREPIWSPLTVAVQSTSAPVASMLDDITATVGTQMVMQLSGDQIAKACGMLFDACQAGWLVHTGQPALDVAAKSAVIRASGDAWTFDRKRSPVDISPLMAAVLAVYALRTFKQPDVKRPRSGRVAGF
jgi:hypothetical protein